MAEEKRPNLKDRLKKSTVVAGAAPPAVAAQGGVMPPVSAPVAPPPGVVPGGAGTSVPPPAMPGGLPGIPGIPGLGGDVAPPAFVQQQQAQAAAAARAAAAAADPFASASHAQPGHNEVRLVIDDKAVADHEVGRGRAGLIIAIIATAAAAGAGGYMVGQTLEVKNQERRTIDAVGRLRTAVTTLGDTINTIKNHVDHAVEAGNIVITRGDEGDSGGQPAAPTHPPDVDDALITWFQSQPGDPPFSFEEFAGSLGRLRSQVVQKLAALTVQFNETWRQLGVISHMNPTTVRAAMNSANPTNNPFHGAGISFARASADLPPVAVVVGVGQPNPQGQIPITGQGIAANSTRTPYATGDIVAANITNLIFPLQERQGITTQVLNAAAFQWTLYVSRVRELKQLVDQLVQTHQQLLDALNSRASGSGS